MNGCIESGPPLATITSIAFAVPSPVLTDTVTPSPTETYTPTPVITPLLVNIGATIYLPLLYNQHSAILIGAGDVTDCYYPGGAMTAQLLGLYPDAAIFTAGDNVHQNGTPDDYANCFAPTWGQYKDRIHPAIGNHEYVTDDGAPYFDYFGDAAGEPGKGYYSYDLGEWHILALNSNLPYQSGSEVQRWLLADLAAHPARCTLAYWHHPLFSGGEMGGRSSMKVLWRNLYAAGVDVVINGHNHDYERFAPQDPDGKLDLAWGIREFVVGTGGGGLDNLPEGPLANTESAIVHEYGVIKLVLNPESYSWEFISASNGQVLDSGEDNCHQ